MREARDTDFFVELPGVGVFRFGRRTYGDRMRIRAEYLRLVRDIGDDDQDLSMYAGMIATHAVLCVEAPSGWADLADVDLTGSADTDNKIFELFALIKQQEDSFRAGASPKRET